MTEGINILLLEDDEAFSSVFMIMMQKRHHQVTLCTTLEQFNEKLPSHAFDLILMDLKLENTTSINHIALAREQQPLAKIIIITAFASISTTVQAIKLGADDYLPKPFIISDVLSAFYKEQDDVPNPAPEKTLTPKQLEWEYLQKVLAENNGNISQTAKALDMHRRTLQRKLNKKPL